MVEEVTPLHVRQKDYGRIYSDTFLGIRSMCWHILIGSLTHT